MPGLEGRYPQNLDRDFDKQERTEGKPAEEVVVNFFKMSGFEARFASPLEDEGRVDIGRKQIIDAVAYLEGRPALGLQITTNDSKEVREKKLAEMRSKPFIRLDEMKSKDLSIPRVLVFLDGAKVNKFKQNPDYNSNPELALQILDSAINSLKFDLVQTKNPLEQKAVNQLLGMMEEEKKKYIH